MMSVIKFRNLFLALLVSFGFLPGGTPAANAQTEPAQTELTPKCETPTVKGDPACWLKAENHDNCYIWNGYVNNEETVTWSGQCRAGKPDGRGKETWENVAGGFTDTYIYIGSYMDGKKHGQWKERRERDNGYWQEHSGPYVNGKRHGEWVEEDMVKRDTGPYADGKRHGEWKDRFDHEGFSQEETGSYVNGKKHGRWKEVSDSDQLRKEETGSYVNGKRHGRWIGKHLYKDDMKTRTSTVYY